MSPKVSFPIIFVKLIDRIALLAEPVRHKRGRPQTCPDRLILKALVIMIIRRLYSLLAILDQETEFILNLCPLLTENGRFPARRAWE